MRSIICGKRILAGLNFVVAATMGSLSVVPDATDFVAVADALGKAAVSAVAIFAEDYSQPYGTSIRRESIAPIQLPFQKSKSSNNPVFN